MSELSDNRLEQTIRTANARLATPDCMCNICVLLRLLDAERARADAAEATAIRLWATWEPYDEDDEGSVPWRLQRDMRAARNG